MLQNLEKYNVPQLFLLMFLQLLDFITTYFCIGLGAIEANPFLAYLMVETGTIWVILYAKFVIIAVLLPFASIAWYYPALIEQWVRPGFMTVLGYMLLIVNAAYIYVVGNNLYLIYTLTN